MAYRNILVSVAPTPEANQLIAKAVAIARPQQGSVTLITQTKDPEIYNQFAAPMLGDLRDLLLEETRLFLEQLAQDANYPIDDQLIVSGELSDHIVATCRHRSIDLVICGNHNQNLFAKLTCSARPVVASSCVDVLLVSLS